MKHCKCGSNDQTVSYRERHMRLLCAACNLDAERFTSTRRNLSLVREDHPETRLWLAPAEQESPRQREQRLARMGGAR